MALQLGLNFLLHESHTLPCVSQHSEEDCGAACLATVARYYGRRLRLGAVREAVGTGRTGTSLLGLCRGAEVLGFHARAVRTSSAFLEHLEQAPLPAIIHWKGIHWVVLYGRADQERYLVADPASGLHKLGRAELLQGWQNGVMLLLEVNPDKFHQIESDEIPGLQRFLRRVEPYKPLLLQAIALNIVIGLLSLATPLMMQLLTDDVLVRGDMQLLGTVAIGVIALNGFSGLVRLVQDHLVGHFSQRLQLGLVLDYGYRLLRLPLSYFDARRTGEVASRIGDVQRINNLVIKLVLGVPSQCFIALLSLAVMVLYSGQLTAYALVAYAIITGIGLLFVPGINEKTKRLIVESSENQGFLVETCRGAMVLKTSQATPQAWEEYQRNFGRLSNHSWGVFRLNILESATNTFLTGLVTILILWIGSTIVIQRQISIGQLIAFSGMSNNCLAFLGMMVGLVDELLTARVVVQRLGEVMDATPETDAQARKPSVTLPQGSIITCSDVSFHHVGRVDLLKDFNLVIPGGQVSAIVGQSGCGKSTLVKLLAGLYPPQSGNIRFGPYNLRDIDLECLRQQVVLIPQEAHFWSRSILDNFRFAYPEANFEAIVEACRIALADGFISELPDQYHTVLGEFGANLSGGQKQRLAIARALLANPEVLILDESTSALDPVLEGEVLEQLLAHRRGSTTILISHRPRVVLRADYVVYLERGTVRFQGHPKELLALPGQHQEYLRP